MVRVVSALLILVSWSITASAQTTTGMARPGQIRGQVRLPDGHPATLGVAVTLEMRGGGGVASQTQTDRSGKFEFMQVAPAMYEVHVRAVGYQPAYQEVDLTTIPTYYVTFVLVSDPSSQPPAVPPGGPGASISAADAAAPEGARKNVEDAEKLLTEGKEVDKGLDLLKKAVKEYPKYSRAYLLMGAAYSSQQNWDEAQDAFKKAVDVDQNDATAYVGLGAVANEKKNYPDAEKYLTKAVELAPESADAHWELGRAYYAQSRWDLADQQVGKANQLRPNISQRHVVMGNILLRERNAEGALKEFQEAVRLDPNGPLAAPTRQMIERIETALKQTTNQKP